MGKIIEDGYLKIHHEDLLNDENTIKWLAKHSVFKSIIANGVVDCLLNDRTDFGGEEDSEWYSIIAFGSSEFEPARKRLFENVDKAAAIQFEMLAKERETYKELYYEYMHKAVDLERKVLDLQCTLERERYNH